MTKVAFIVCYNNELYMRECLNYISFLNIPEGVEIETIGIYEADSMAAGYNAAMRSSDAKYKVYLHQDVFILNENFIRDIIAVFEQNQDYGMLGVFGSDRIVVDANYYLRWNTGCTYADDSLLERILYTENVKPLQEVVAVDGMIMITQYDIEWKEEIFDGFDFYDISQSMEFQKAGYKVGVPYQETPWCNHVCGHSKVDNYDIYRKLFCEEYADCGYIYTEDDALEESRIKNVEVERILPLIYNAFEENQMERAEALLTRTMQFHSCNTKLCELFVLSQIREAEKRAGIENGFYEEGMSISALQERYALHRFLLKRLMHDKPIADMSDIMTEIAEYDSYGLEAEKVIAEHAVVRDERVIWKLKRTLEENYIKEYKVSFDNKIYIVPNEEGEQIARNCCEAMNIIVNKLKSMKEGVDNRQCLRQVDEIFTLLEDVCKNVHIGYMEEPFYMAYFDVMEKQQNMQRFIEECQKWQKNVMSYLDREEREPLVSVLISVYNGEDFVEDTLKSVMEQSYKNLQIIVVDDCSSDQSRNVIERLAQADNRIEPLYLEKNCNVCKASNLGYELARGRYLALIGHDDIWKPDKIEKQVHFMEMNREYAACFTLCDIIDDDKKICNMQAEALYKVFDQRNRSQKEWVNQLLFNENVLCAPSVLLRTGCLQKKQLYCYGLVQFQDRALWLELLKKHPLYIMQEQLVLYRKFLKKESNLSAFNATTRNRLKHEERYLISNFIKKVETEKLCCFASERFRDKAARTKAQVDCERAFLLFDMDDLHCIDMFIELFENEETRNILENKYHFTLKDFYEINSKTFSYDAEAQYQLMIASNTIKQCEEVIERQNKMIEALQ